ncbi:efflux RND transporter periplasmic adaptor subunit [Luteimonas sp. 50]|uniref:Efflux RND transporter periplasmic adaptor subunit n=1 Tax=Cognatiluteimonas sedimenti TaxID=2927791 RepID=A0ABT0A6P5_9GAMM|nr:efflux RND transporter periplasmic adaptor subunit [Lysobacter sedimenti]MCJ0826651.1 efflux RND transporter periplasmic adaptor subunit [Lysobacter sedimenti]
MRRPLVVLALSATLFAAAGCSKDQAAAGGPPGGAMPPPEVGVVVMHPATVPIGKDLVGRLSAFRSADVRARVPGVLQRRLYEEGSDVRKGQVLFRIDPAPLQAAAAQARGALAQAQASAANARAFAERARGLIDGKFISRSDYDNAIAAERSSLAAVQAARAAVQAADINLGYATVRAPISGRAGKQQVTEGALVGQGEPTLLTTVDQLDPMYIDFSMSVGELAQVRALGAARADANVQVLLPDGTPYPHPGTLDFSGDVVDPATGAVSLRARVDNPDGVLLPGTFVTLKAVLGEERDAFLVPQAAVQRDAKSAYVLVVGKDGKVARKDIATERAQGADWVLHEGVAEGDQVIVSGLQRAIPGQPAKAAPMPAPGQAPPQAAAAPVPAQG